MQLRARLAEAIQLHTPKFDRKGQIPLPVVIGKGCVMVQGINRNSGGSDEETGIMTESCCCAPSHLFFFPLRRGTRERFWLWCSDWSQWQWFPGISLRAEPLA